MFPPPPPPKKKKGGGTYFWGADPVVIGITVGIRLKVSIAFCLQSNL